VRISTSPVAVISTPVPYHFTGAPARYASRLMIVPPRHFTGEDWKAGLFTVSIPEAPSKNNEARLSIDLSSKGILQNLPGPRLSLVVYGKNPSPPTDPLGPDNAIGGMDLDVVDRVINQVRVLSQWVAPINAVIEVTSLIHDLLQVCRPCIRFQLFPPAEIFGEFSAPPFQEGISPGAGQNRYPQG